MRLETRASGRQAWSPQKLEDSVEEGKRADHTNIERVQAKIIAEKIGKVGPQRIGRDVAVVKRRLSAGKKECQLRRGEEGAVMENQGGGMKKLTRLQYGRLSISLLYGP